MKPKLYRYGEGGEYGNYPVGVIDDIYINFNHTDSWDLLSSKKYNDMDKVKYIRPKHRSNGSSYLDKDLLMRRTFEKKWDFVLWINCEEPN